MSTDVTAAWLAEQADVSLQRLLPRLREAFHTAAPADWLAFERRLTAHFPRLFRLLHHLYGSHYDFFYHLEQILLSAASLSLARPAELKALDAEREAQPDWFQSEQMLGGVCYVDLFAGNLAGIRAKLPYFRELGLTYLHLMPLFASPAGENDGGYAVSSYRDVNPALGTMAELSELAAELRREGISLVLDFILNHTSDEHRWAQAALAGDPVYQGYYYMFPDRAMPDAYEKTLREIFPGVRPGSFTYRPEIGKWVWTTFYSFQWDLNYRNPAVFRAMMEEMLSLANAGVEVLRYDALAFIWKELGTPCESLPEAHMLVQAFNALTRIAAPALLFKSEAIVHPDEVAQYISPDECQISYNPLLMALQWEALATREVKLLRHSLAGRFHIHPGCAWVNYVRSHDDIGWTFDDGDAAQVGVNGFDHRRFLNAFYTGRFPGSFARGLPFQENPRTGDARISGTCASLAGLGEGAARGRRGGGRWPSPHPAHVWHRASIGGIPLIYLGDEIGTLNDYSYRSNPAKASDSRCSPPRDQLHQLALREEPDTIEGRVYGRLRHDPDAQTLPRWRQRDRDHRCGQPHVFGYRRRHGRTRRSSWRTSASAARPLRQTSSVRRAWAEFRDLVGGDTLELTRRDAGVVPVDVAGVERGGVPLWGLRQAGLAQKPCAVTSPTQTRTDSGFSESCGRSGFCCRTASIEDGSSKGSLPAGCAWPKRRRAPRHRSRRSPPADCGPPQHFRDDRGPVQVDDYDCRRRVEQRQDLLLRLALEVQVTVMEAAGHRVARLHRIPGRVQADDCQLGLRGVGTTSAYCPRPAHPGSARTLGRPVTGRICSSFFNSVIARRFARQHRLPSHRVKQHFTHPTRIHERVVKQA